MPKVSSLLEVLGDELKDIYSSEHQILQALPKLAKKAACKKLRQAFENHLEETKKQVERLDEIGKILNIKLTGKKCKATEGLIEEGKDALETESDNPALVDCLLIGAAQRVEHYEMAAYGSACAMAEELGLEDVVVLLQKTLSEEEAADETLTTIAETDVLPDASDSDGDDDEDEPRKQVKSA